MINKNQRTNEGGFTLIEMSVLILILSFVLVPLFNIMHQQRLQKERIAAEEINERLLSAMSVYLKNNGHFPCPADPTLSYGDTGFGVADCSAAANSGPGPNVKAGDVPTYDLGIPYRLMYNSDNFKYHYAVTTSQTTAYNGGGNITIVDAAGANIVTGIPFVIVNFGGDGKGREKQANGRIQNNSCDPPPGGASNTADDVENCDNDAVFRDMLYSVKSNPGLQGHYDDLVFYDLAREESTHWSVMHNGPNIDIVTRNTGNIGIGDYTAPGAKPNVKLEVKGGDVRLEAGEVKAEGQVKAPEFYYP